MDRLYTTKWKCLWERGAYIVYLVIPNTQYQVRVSIMNDWQTDLQNLPCHLDVAEEIQCSCSHGHHPKGKPFWGHTDRAFWSNLDGGTNVKQYEGIEFWFWSVLTAVRKHFRVVCTLGKCSAQSSGDWKTYDKNASRFDVCCKLALYFTCTMCNCAPAISALGRLRQDCGFQASLDYIAKLYPKSTKQIKLYISHFFITK